MQISNPSITIKKGPAPRNRFNFYLPTVCQVNGERTNFALGWTLCAKIRKCLHNFRWNRKGVGWKEQGSALNVERKFAVKNVKICISESYGENCGKRANNFKQTTKHRLWCNYRNLKKVLEVHFSVSICL